MVVLGGMLDTTVLSSNQTGSKVFTFACQPHDIGCILGPDNTGNRVAGIVLCVVYIHGVVMYVFCVLQYGGTALLSTVSLNKYSNLMLTLNKE